MLSNLILSKLQYHNREVLGIQLRTNGDVSKSIKRIEKLKASQESIEKIIKHGQTNNFQFQITAVININFIINQTK